MVGSERATPFELSLDVEAIILEMTPDGWIATQLTPAGWLTAGASTIDGARGMISARLASRSKARDPARGRALCS